MKERENGENEEGYSGRSSIHQLTRQVVSGFLVTDVAVLVAVPLLVRATLRIAGRRMHNSSILRRHVVRRLNKRVTVKRHPYFELLLL